MLSTSKSFIILHSVDSTNNYAMGMVRNGVVKHGDAWFSYEQTHGKGRRGKSWKADKAKNIILSIAVDTSVLTLYQQFYISIAASLGTLDFLKQFAGDDCKIKWPNDIFWNDRKAGGMLIENVIKGNKWQWAIVGIGININQTEFDVDGVFKPVSIKQITGKEYDVVELSKNLQLAVLGRYEELTNMGFGGMLTEYNQYLFGLNEKVRLKKDNIVFETVIKRVSPQGQLITADEIVREFDFDEVEWVRE